jgi:hypothetical protein
VEDLLVLTLLSVLVAMMVNEVLFTRVAKSSVETKKQSSDTLAKTLSKRFGRVKRIANSVTIIDLVTILAIVMIVIF